MFKNASVADFDVDGHKAQFIIDNSMPVQNVQAVLNKIMHFCVERLKEAENEEAQRIKDEESAKPPELEKESALESEIVETEEVNHPSLKGEACESKSWS